jgi:hypothetical protein
MLVDNFVGREGELFLVRSDASSAQVQLTLASVTTWGHPVFEGARQPFTLLFHGVFDPWLPQAIYPFDHPALGEFDMFIVPVGPDEVGMRYEAVFS